jgi:hypothetical protein
MVAPLATIQPLEESLTVDGKDIAVPGRVAGANVAVQLSPKRIATPLNFSLDPKGVSLNA